MHLNRSLEELGFKKYTQEHAVYTRDEGEASILVGVYVDDLIVTGSSTEKINKFKQQMMTKFEMSDLGLLSYYLGIEVEQQKSQILLRQSAYAKKILSQFKMADYNATKHPMEPKTQLHKDLEGTPVEAMEYMHIIGCLRYLLHTWSDLSYSVGMMSRYMERHTIMYHKAVKQILRDPRKLKQKTMTLSSCEAEFMAAATAILGQQLVPLVNVDADHLQPSRGYLLTLETLAVGHTTGSSEIRRRTAASRCSCAAIALLELSIVRPPSVSSPPVGGNLCR
ncbi:uncharacterized mitochondrial protein AtMg00810-like [Zingiber officinale]|uniref:uncharacterized mitochondrial protein AtMg00810-like n=1 Tax=Zingiber officinale TaxID=94328 RepID=UPI001C4C2AAE|nr:uncharacterized mitochondrial protein AtMg00810-like [Zingiber officinale]